MESSHREVSWGRCLAVALGLSWAALPALAQDAASTGETPVRLEVNASTLPRIDSLDGGFNAPRVDLSVLPARNSGMGVAVGMSGLTPRAGLQPGWSPAARPALDLGLTWRHTLDSDRQIDVTAWKRMQQQQDAYSLAQQRQPLYGARVEMSLQPVRKQGLTMERGFIGFQLQGDARISIKRRNGKPMIYYRTSF